jgi:hypothetical protein
MENLLRWYGTMLATVGGTRQSPDSLVTSSRWRIERFLRKAKPAEDGAVFPNIKGIIVVMAKSGRSYAA